jgi:hypothetical protein
MGNDEYTFYNVDDDNDFEEVNLDNDPTLQNQAINLQ